MIIHRMPQLSVEWFELRRATPSASNFDRIITPKTGKLAAAHKEYAYELAAELIRLDPPIFTDGPVTPAMRHGTECEPEARRYYEMHRDCEVEQVGCIATDDGRFLCSPDGLMPSLNRGLELKCVAPKTQVKYLDQGTLPDEYKAQLHGALIVSGYESWDFLSYCPPFPPLLIEVRPDSFTEALRDCLEQFWLTYLAVLDKLGHVHPSRAGVVEPGK